MAANAVGNLVTHRGRYVSIQPHFLCFLLHLFFKIFVAQCFISTFPLQARGFCLLEHSTTHWKSGICPYGSTSPSPIIERTDTGSTYFRHFFYGKEHQNWFGVDEALGPVALSIRRERVVGGGEGQAGPGGGHHLIISITITPGGGQGGMQEHFMYRLIVRTSELLPLRLRQLFQSHLQFKLS